MHTPGTFFQLPSGEYIRPSGVEAIRVQREKADKATGELSARVHIQHRESWFTVPFQREGDAQAFADLLAGICDQDRGTVQRRPLTAADAEEMMARLRLHHVGDSDEE